MTKVLSGIKNHDKTFGVVYFSMTKINYDKTFAGGSIPLSGNRQFIVKYTTKTFAIFYCQGSKRNASLLSGGGGLWSVTYRVRPVCSWKVTRTFGGTSCFWPHANLARKVPRILKKSPN